MKQTSVVKKNKIIKYDGKQSRLKGNSKYDEITMDLNEVLQSGIETYVEHDLKSQRYCRYVRSKLHSKPKVMRTGLLCDIGGDTSLDLELNGRMQSDC